MSHVAGIQMIAQCTDGVSRGCLNEILQAKGMLQHIPYNQSALERCSKLLSWLKSWRGGDLEVLDSMEWFYRGHDLNGGSYNQKGFWINEIKKGDFLWCPPPGAANIALEQL